MLIKCFGLTLNFSKSLPGVCYLIGNEAFQMATIAEQIKTHWLAKQNNDSETKVIHIDNDSNWQEVIQETSNYSLFNLATLIDIRYEKKTLDNKGKEFFINYLKSINPCCLILFRAPYLSLKALQFTISNECSWIIQLFKLDSKAIHRWISERISIIYPKYDKKIPDLIQQYTQGNLLATAQFLEKLELLHDDENQLTLDLVKEHLIIQCDYSLFELIESILENNIGKSINLLRQARNNRTEPTLVLWLIAQELRLFIQLIDPHSNASFKERFDRLKIWNRRLPLYQNAVKRFNYSELIKLLNYCGIIDKRIKTGIQSQLIWQQLELILIALSSSDKLLPYA